MILRDIKMSGRLDMDHDWDFCWIGNFFSIKYMTTPKDNQLKLKNFKKWKLIFGRNYAKLCITNNKIMKNNYTDYVNRFFSAYLLKIDLSYYSPNDNLFCVRID
jgi:hypothetical protein